MFLQKSVLKFLGYALRRISLFLVLFVLLLTGVFSYTRVGTQETAYAATSSNLNFQARLLTSSGNTVPDGYYNLEFKLYDTSATGEQAQGTCSANCLWSETYDYNGGAPDRRVRTVNGYFSVNLGSLDSLGDENIDWDEDIWLSMRVGDSTQVADWEDDEMSPRVKLTAVPYALQAKQSEKLVKTTAGGGVGTVDFASLTANRLYLLPDSPLATTGSPGTICIFNGSSSNCPAATGSANYIQNATASQTLQVDSNFHIQATDDGANNGSVGGIISAAADGQTVDLFQLRASDASTVLTHFDAIGRLAIVNSATAVSALTVGTNTTNEAGGITFGSDANRANLYRSANDQLTTDDALIVASLLTGQAGLTVTGAGSSLSGGIINLNVSSNFATNINTGTSTGAVSIGNSLAGAINLQSASTVNVNNTAGVVALSVDTVNAITSLRGLNSTATLGAEKVTNGTFTGNATGWTLGTGWAYNSNNVTKTAGTASDLEQNVSAVNGETYRVVFTVSGWTAGCVRPQIGGVGGTYICTNSTTETQVITATGTGNLQLHADAAFAGTVDTVSVMRITASNAVLEVRNSSNAIALEVRGGNTSSSYVGLNAGRNDSGSWNSGFGSNALRSNTTGGENVAIGADAMYSNTTGSENTAVGAFSLTSNTTGDENTAIGSYSLQSNVTGSENVALGIFALNSSGTGSRNTALGNDALEGNTTGSNNVGLGYQAGQTSVSANRNQSGTNNTFIGYDSGPGSATQLQNSSAIGTYSVVSQNDSLVLGCINGVNGCTANTKVGIGTATPGAALEVADGGLYLTGAGTIARNAKLEIQTGLHSAQHFLYLENQNGVAAVINGSGSLILGGANGNSRLSIIGTGLSNGITFNAASGGGQAYLYTPSGAALRTDNPFTAGGRITSEAGITSTGATISLNDSSNFNTSINTGNSTGTISIGNSASTGFTLENGTGTTNLFNGATAHTIQLATGAAAQSVTIGSTNTTSATSIQGGVSGAINIGSVGSSTLSSTTNIANTSDGTGTQAVNIGSGANAANAVTLQAGATGGINLNSATIDSNAATLALFGTPTSITLGAAATTLNIGPTGNGASSILLSGGSADTGCTIDGSNGNLTCSGTISGSTAYLAKNSADTSSAAVTASNYLYGFTNSSSAVASGVLNIDNGTNTGNALRVTTAGNPGAGNALIFASNTNASPSGNLLDLQSGSSPTSVFKVNADGVTTSASQITSYYGDSGQIILTRNNPGGEARIVLGNSGQVYITHTNANELSVTGSLIIEGASSNLTVQGTGTSNFVGNVDIAGTLKAGTSDAFQVGATGVVNYVAGSTDTAAAVCRNAAGQLAGCNTTGNGAAFIQGGNAFAATAVLGTTDANGLQIVTGSGGPNGRAYFDTSNNLYLGNAGTTGLAAAPNAFTISGTGSSAAAGGAAGGNLTIKAGLGTATGSGSAGGVLALAGGAAQGDGTVARNGGDLTLDGGALIGAGTKGNVILQGSGGNVGIGIATPGAKLDVKGINTSNSILALSVAGSSGTGLQVSNANTVSIGVAPFEHTALRITKDFGALNASFDAAIGIQANVTASANADGTSEVDGVIGNAILAGSNAPAYIIGGAFSGINAATGAGNVPFVYGVTAVTSSTGSKSTDDLIAIKASNRLSSSGNATRATGLYVDSPTASSTGRITTNYGIYINTQATAAVTGSAYGIYQLGASDLNYFAGNVGLGDTVPSTKLSLGGTGVSNGITLGDDAASPVNLYRNANDELKTDDAFIVAGLLTGQAGATVSGAAINLNASSNFNTSINTGNSTGTISIGNSASTGFTLENGTGTGVNGVNLFNGATAHTIQLATGAAVQSVTVGSTNTTSSLTLQAGTGLLNIGNDNVAKTTTINIGAEATGADLIALGSSNAGSTLTLLGGTGAAAIQIGNNAASTGIQIGNANGDKDIIIGNSQNSGSTISIEGGTAATGIQIGNSTAAHGIQIGSNATGDNDILLGGANAGSTLILEGGTAASAIQIGNGATAHGIQIGTGAAVQTLVIGSTNTTSATSIQGGVSGAINIGSVGSSTLSSTTNIANTSDATGTQTINLGSSANAANVINLAAGSTGGVKLNTQLAATANSQYLCRDSSTAILTACNTTGNGAAFIQGRQCLRCYCCTRNY